MAACKDGSGSLPLAVIEERQNKSNQRKPRTYLGSTSDHVLDEITVTGSVNNGDIVLRSLELPEGDVDGDTTLTLGLQLVQDPGVLEGTLSDVSGFLLELLNGTLVDTTAGSLLKKFGVSWCVKCRRCE